MTQVSRAQITDMRRLILIARNQEPLVNKIRRRYITISDNAKANLRGTLYGLAMIHDAMRR